MLRNHSLVLKTGLFILCFASLNFVSPLQAQSSDNLERALEGLKEAVTRDRFEAMISNVQYFEERIEIRFRNPHIPPLFISQDASLTEPVFSRRRGKARDWFIPTPGYIDSNAYRRALTGHPLHPFIVSDEAAPFVARPGQHHVKELLEQLLQKTPADPLEHGLIVVGPTRTGKSQAIYDLEKLRQGNGLHLVIADTNALLAQHEKNFDELFNNRRVLRFGDGTQLKSKDLLRAADLLKEGASQTVIITTIHQVRALEAEFNENPLLVDQVAASIEATSYDEGQHLSGESSASVLNKIRSSSEYRGFFLSLSATPARMSLSRLKGLDRFTVISPYAAGGPKVNEPNVLRDRSLPFEHLAQAITNGEVTTINSLRFITPHTLGFSGDVSDFYERQGADRGLYHIHAPYRRAVFDYLEPVLRENGRALIVANTRDEASQLTELFNAWAENSPANAIAKLRFGAYHSGISDRKSTLGDFQDGKIDVLIIVRALTEGITFNRVSLCVDLTASTNAEGFLQKIGRVLGLEEGKTGANILLTAMNGLEDREDLSLMLLRFLEFPHVFTERSPELMKIRDDRVVKALQDLTPAKAEKLEKNFLDHLNTPRTGMDSKLQTLTPFYYLTINERQRYFDTLHQGNAAPNPSDFEEPENRMHSLLDQAMQLMRGQFSEAHELLARFYLKDERTRSHGAELAEERGASKAEQYKDVRQAVQYIREIISSLITPWPLAAFHMGEKKLPYHLNMIEKSYLTEDYEAPLHMGAFRGRIRDVLPSMTKYFTQSHHTAPYTLVDDAPKALHVLRDRFVFTQSLQTLVLKYGIDDVFGAYKNIRAQTGHGLVPSEFGRDKIFLQNMLNPPPALQTHYTVEVQEAAVRFYELIKDELTSDERQKFENRFVKPVAGFDPSDELSSYKLTPRELLTKVWRLGRSRELEGIFKANAAANPSLPQKRVKFKIRVKAPKTECENFFDDDDDFGATDDFRIEWPGKFLKDKYGGVSI